jgi:predicted O-methyltransferase YrrM
VIEDIAAEAKTGTQRLVTGNNKQLNALLSGSHDGQQGISPVEVEHLAWLGANMPNGGDVVEIGSHRGKSICCIASGIRHAGKTARIFCCDLWMEGKGKTFDHYASKETWDIFNKQVNDCGFTGKIVPVKGDANQSAKKRSRPIHLLFIDAGHKYKDVVKDCWAWSKFVAPGGRIAFHDFGTRFPGVDQVVNEEVIASGLWEDYQVHGRIWSARRK